MNRLQRWWHNLWLSHWNEQHRLADYKVKYFSTFRRPDGSIPPGITNIINGYRDRQIRAHQKILCLQNSNNLGGSASR